MGAAPGAPPDGGALRRDPGAGRQPRLPHDSPQPSGPQDIGPTQGEGGKHGPKGAQPGPPVNGAQPSQQSEPLQTGLNALYGVMQIFVQLRQQ